MHSISPPELVQAAIRVLPYCYAPYSHFRVAAALLTASGQVYCGVNIENVAFSPSICAERAAVASAISQGGRNFTAIAVVSAGAVAPCGVCRQVLGEFNPNLLVIRAEMDGRIHSQTSLATLLPDAFLNFSPNAGELHPPLDDRFGSNV